MNSLGSNFFNKETASYLSNVMCFDLSHIDSALERLCERDQQLIISLVEKCIEISRQMEAPCGYQDIQNPIRKQINKLLPDEKFFCSRQAYLVADAFRFSFTHFVAGGLLDMYEHQENECWHPKILIKNILEPNDISELLEEIIIYRGCSSQELETENFGQAWSTSLKVASEFAFEHYASQGWFKKEERIVIKASISRSDIYYAKNSGEFEVVVNSKKIVKPIVIETGLEP